MSKSSVHFEKGVSYYWLGQRTSRVRFFSALTHWCRNKMAELFIIVIYMYIYMYMYIYNCPHSSGFLHCGTGTMVRPDIWHHYLVTDKGVYGCLYSKYTWVHIDNQKRKKNHPLLVRRLSLSQEMLINTMTVDDLVTCVARSSTYTLFVNT